MLLRRVLHAAVALAFATSLFPARASATTTAAEIAQAHEQDKAVVDQYGVVGDPLLNAWCNEVGDKVWAQTARHDVPYNIKILDSNDINSFTIGGGYIYVNEGLLDFVQSDDELAGVIGHETGHNERRHTVTLPAKAQLLNLLFGVASIFSPILYNFGGIAQAGIIAKLQRSDELQADEYGLLLMSRAGYDPDSMLSFMHHLGAAEDDHSALVDKYLADHPGFPDRVNHLLGYKELDPKTRTNDQLLVQAQHDQQSSRYSVASMKFQKILGAEPANATALLDLGQSQIALGETSKGEQTLASAAQSGTSQTRDVALASIRSLRESEARFQPLKQNLAPLRAALADAKLREMQSLVTIQTRREAGKDQLKAVDTRVQNISYEIPDLSRIQARRGSRLEAVLKNINTMGRSIDVAFTKSRQTIAGVGSMERNKEGGLVKEDADILREMEAPLQLDVVPAQSLSTLPYYPRMLDGFQATDGDIIRSLDASRSSLAILDVALGDVDTFIKRLSRANFDFAGDISQLDYAAMQPLMQTAADGLAKAAVAGSQGQQLFDLARARQIQTRITMIGVGYPENRYATFTTALQQRVKNPGVDYQTMVRDDLSPGQVAAAAIVAADTNTTPEAVIAQAKTESKSIVDVANERGMHAKTLEIFLGLVYLDYTDDPYKEAHDHA